MPTTTTVEVIGPPIPYGYILATPLCQAVGKRMDAFLRLSSTKDFLRSLSTEVEIPTAELIHIRLGGPPGMLRGTWVHPQIAPLLDQWIAKRLQAMGDSHK